MTFTLVKISLKRIWVGSFSFWIFSLESFQGFLIAFDMIFGLLLIATEMFIPLRVPFGIIRWFT